MLLFPFFYFALQINSWFTIRDVQHLMTQRLGPLPVKRIEYDDIRGFDAMIIPTKIAKHVIVVAESNRMHFFYHDTESICNCLWDKNITYCKKKEIASSIVSWLNQTNVSYKHRLYDHEDDIAFTEAIQELEDPTQF